RTRPGVFNTDERRLLVVEQAVYRYAAGKDPRGHVARAAHISPAHVGVQAVARIVGNPDRVFVIVIGDDAEDRAENLVAGDRHVVLHIDEDGRVHEGTRLWSLG